MTDPTTAITEPTREQYRLVGVESTRRNVAKLARMDLSKLSDTALQCLNDQMVDYLEQIGEEPDYD